jgi:DNA-directed RNA polymerase sigma subunit (sigma70/sigma32)
MRKNIKSDILFISFVEEMNVMLREKENKESKQTKQYINELISLEKTFKKTLLDTPHGNKIYEQFMHFILDDEDGKGNMLSARVYFRERQDTFSKKMYTAFHQKNYKKLQVFKINYKFCVWALEKYTGRKKSALTKILNKMEDIRKAICEKNLPLAINRANLFWRNTSNPYLDYMDLIQNAAEGLLIAVDKFVPAKGRITNNREFNGVSIGKMTLEMQENNSQTLVKLPPKEKRILYRTKKAKETKMSISKEEVVDYVSQSFGGVTSSDIERIEAAANQGVSIDEKIDGQHSFVEKFIDTSESVHDKVENLQINIKMLSVFNQLTVLEKKIVLMKFGDMYGGLCE